MPVALIIRDGWGWREAAEGNAVLAAATPHHDRLRAAHPVALLEASGPAVGLPEGQFGNSEVGHRTLGAGRILLQPLSRVDAAIASGEWASNTAWLSAGARVRGRGAALHLVALLSDGGVHSHMRHLEPALALAAAQRPPGQVWLHAITDGRDSAAQGAGRFLEQALAACARHGVRLASLCGRALALDRDSRWDRTGAWLDLVLRGRGERCEDILGAVTEHQRGGRSDEHIPPLRVITGGEAAPVIGADDGVWVLAFRGDRARQLTRGLCDPALSAWPRPHIVADVTTLTDYDPSLPVAGVALPTLAVRGTLGEVAAREGAGQWRVAETEKFAHVTTFFNGGQEAPFPGEERRLYASPKVATYDLAPEMRAADIAEGIAARMAEARDALIVANLANPDMVGHTGDFAATARAVEAVDAAVGRICAAAAAQGWSVALTADHGNAERMLEADGSPRTAHADSPVELILVDGRVRELAREGGLADLAPTLLELLGWPQPAEMTGRSLLR